MGTAACMNPKKQKKTNSTTKNTQQKESRLRLQLSKSSIFSDISCPIDNSQILDKALKYDLVENFTDSKYIWKQIQFGKQGIKLSATCNWQPSQSLLVNGRAALYSLKKNSQFLIIGLFKNGNIILGSKYLKIFGNGSQYQGPLNDQLQCQGKGQIIYALSKQKYIGDFMMGVPNGKGQFIQQRKHFIGDVVMGQKKKGKQISQYGQYIGDFNGKQRHGHGILILKNGVKYDGDFFQNKRHGFGTLYNQKGQVEYSGKWGRDKKLK